MKRYADDKQNKQKVQNTVKWRMETEGIKPRLRAWLLPARETTWYHICNTGGKAVLMRHGGTTRYI